MRRLVLVFITLLLGLTTLAGLPFTPKAAALSGSSWLAGRIIDDPLFTNKNSMSIQQVQAFLNANVGTGGAGHTPGVCDTNGTGTSELGGGTRAQYGAAHGNPAPFTCLKDYWEVPKTTPGAGIPANNYGGKPIPSGAQSAAQIIWNAAQANNISPKVLLVLIQKESAGPLITDDWPFASQYTYAMGSHCPDTSGCDPNYAGFSMQVNSAAQLLRYYLNNMTQSWWPYKKLGVNNILYNPSSSCGASNVNIVSSATAALYTYTPYQPNAAALANLYGTGNSCSSYGNRNFWRMFNDWFGSTLMPYAFKSSTSPIYYYVDGYKIQVTAMGILQDYGISPQSIQTVDQSTVDAIPTPDVSSGLSSTLGYLVKSPSDSDDDGGSIYLISVGKRNQVTTMQQLSDFGFSASDITYMPLDFILSMPNGGPLSNFIKSPEGAVFRVSSGQKRLIFDYPTYISLNPSDAITYVSYFDADLVASGIPLANKEILVKYATSDAVYLLVNGTYYNIPSFDIYKCWGFESTLKTPVYRTPNNSYIAPISTASDLNCLVKNTSNATYLLSNTSKFPVPSSYNLTPISINTDLSNLMGKLPTSSTIKQYIKGANSMGVWYLENGRKIVPSLSNFNLLGLSAAQIDTVDDSSISSIPSAGLKLATGQLVKGSGSPAVYVISGNSRILYATSEDFLAYGNSWDSVEAYPQDQLDQNYSFNAVSINRYLYSSSPNGLYLVDANGCYSLDSALQTSYGQSESQVHASQGYDAGIFASLNLSRCAKGSEYVKAPGQALVYWLDNGTKHPVTSWNALVTKSGTTNPYVITLSASTLQTFPTGSSL